MDFRRKKRLMVGRAYCSSLFNITGNLLTLLLLPPLITPIETLRKRSVYWYRIIRSGKRALQVRFRWRLHLLHSDYWGASADANPSSPAFRLLDGKFGLWENKDWSPTGKIWCFWSLSSLLSCNEKALLICSPLDERQKTRCACSYTVKQMPAYFGSKC